MITLCSACLLAFANPIVDMDMSDPDCWSADGTNFLLTVSSFTDVPGLPLYASTDLVNWRLAGHALAKRPKECTWTRRGQGVWAPAIRFHSGQWHVFWGDPDAGIFQVTAKTPEGPWSEPTLVQAGKGLIDPCPLWDEDGELHTIVPKCPHMGCQLEWNPDEKSWDCPCHGSRFDIYGRLLIGPAQTDLA